MSQVSRKNLSSPTMWRSLEELANTPEFEEMLHREFPDAASEWEDGPSRRSFLKLMAASLALAGVAGCNYKPREEIVPYISQPEQVVPGRPMFFASAMTHNGFARGVIVQSHEGRPTKIEGNPDHPASLGSTDIWMQATLLDLYDPDRSQTVMRAGEVSNWSNFVIALTGALERHRKNGAGLRILTRTVTSPTLTNQIKNYVLKDFPGAKWHKWDPINCDNAAAGAKMAFGRNVDAVYHFDRAKVIVSLDDNFLIDHPGSVRYARDFTNGRRVRKNRREMNRLYVAESTPSITGAMADHRLSVKPSEIEAIARQLREGNGEGWVAAAAKDLAANHGASLIVAGESQPPIVHAIAHAMNVELGNVGKTVTYIDPIAAGDANHLESITSLVNDINAGAVQTLIILGGNPVYDAPADLKFGDALKKLSEEPTNLTAHLATHNDETSFLAQWHLPLAHELESWGDATAFDGTVSVIQPLIAPLYQGRSAIEVVALLLGQQDRSGHEIIRDYWRPWHDAANAAQFEQWWEKWLRDGVIAFTGGKVVDVQVKTDIGTATTQATTKPTGGYEIVFRPDPSLWDGTYGNNGWLQELPKPLTKLTWDNAAIMSHRTAVDLGVINVNEEPGNDLETTIVELTVGGTTTKAPAWILPGQPDGVITVYLGLGRTHAGRVGNNVGFDAYALRTSNALWFARGSVKPTDQTMTVACTQNHSMMEQGERDLVRAAPIAQYDSVAKPEENAKGKTVPLSLYEPWDYSKQNKWGMVIDENTCIGCNACVVACQSENNIPVVGKEQVSKGREMQWLRIDAYFTGEPDHPEGPYFQPIPCMHCELAPCEVVCPVEATVHDAEGINNMVYNRCIGTRYCSNNCPYKVRHFNFLHYTENITGPLKLAMNPNVTVRYRGVMEKCSYCIQRISVTRIDSKIDNNRPIRDGEVQTACQQSCPTLAITFGNLNDNNAAVTKLTNEPTNYGLLDELQTKPRTTYLPRFTNPAGAKET